MVDKNSLVVHSNVITSAAYRLSVVEARIILTAISLIPHNEPPSDDKLYWVTSKALMDLGSNAGSVNKLMNESAKSIYGRTIRLPTENGYRDFRWVQEIEYDNKNGRVGLRFSTPMLPYLYELKNSFTKYNLIAIKDLKSEYAIRIYAMCCQFAGTGWRSMSIQELREALVLTDKYKSINLFAKRVLDVAVNQINASEYANLQVQYSLIKTGRTYTGVRFTFKTKSANERGVITLTVKQAYYFAFKLRNDEKIWMRFYAVARNRGLNLLGASEEEVFERTAEWLTNADNVAMSLEFLVEAGFKMP